MTLSRRHLSAWIEQQKQGFTAKEFGLWRGNTKQDANLSLLTKLRKEGYVDRVGRGLFARWASINNAKAALEYIEHQRIDSQARTRIWNMEYHRQWRGGCASTDTEVNIVWMSKWPKPEITGHPDVFSYAQSHA
jgi:hypothetical protein